MINWEFFQPRNFVVIAALSVLAFMVYNHFAGKSATDDPAVGV